ncbi:hypothetical protein Tco_0745404 [Tanacetum coccineum]
MARMDAMTLKMDTQYKELQSKAKKTKPDLDEDEIPMSREEEAKFMQTFRKTRFYYDYRDQDSNRDNWHSNERIKQKQLNLGVRTERMIFNIDSAMKHSYSNDDTCFSIDVIDEILEEDFDALLNEGTDKITNHRKQAKAGLANGLLRIRKVQSRSQKSTKP